MGFGCNCKAGGVRWWGPRTPALRGAQARPPKGLWSPNGSTYRG